VNGAGDDDTKAVPRELTEFIHALAHDLHQPLAKILTISELLKVKAKNLDEADRDYLMRMHEAARQMRTLIDEMARGQVSSFRSLQWQTPREK
jgi:signal transduction histidine kinase